MWHGRRGAEKLGRKKVSGTFILGGITSEQREGLTQKRLADYVYGKH